MDLALNKLGYNPETEDERERLRHVHFFTDCQNINEHGFELRVGIGLPVSAGHFLMPHLYHDPPDKRMVARLRKTGNLPPTINEATEAEAWVANFAFHIGTISVSWIAQAFEP